MLRRVKFLHFISDVSSSINEIALSKKIRRPRAFLALEVPILKIVLLTENKSKEKLRICEQAKG